ncbi:MAG: alanine:cation symporter family protein [Treponema sp.]|nr:alanine:cation symporter family protein [Treponema sp.]
MFSQINSILNAVDDKVWGLWLIVLILATGILLTLRLKGLQFSKLGSAIRAIGKKSDEGSGEVSSLGALCTALSATIGTGNIVGVATAIAAGGPGALFWMWLAALFGMATKYAECLLAFHYREVTADGHILGGPFYTIEKGMGTKWKPFAKLFAVFGTVTGLFGMGTFTQVNSISSAINTFFDPQNLWTVTLFGNEYSWTVVIAGVLVAVFAALIIIGGLKRIARVSEILVPTMAVVYVTLGVVIIVANITKVPAALAEIVTGAFGFRAAAGGALGTMFIAMQKGIARGIFSNEAGLGSAPIAASAAKSAEPVQQGLVSMTGTFFDTIIICSITGIVIVLGGTWNTDLQGYAITNAAFMQGIPVAGKLISFFLMVCLALFAFTTILGWDYYSERCLEYLSGGNMNLVKTYRWLYIVCVFFGPYMTVSAVWTIADIVNGLMAVPNIISLLALSGVAVKLTNDYFTKS